MAGRKSPEKPYKQTAPELVFRGCFVFPERTSRSTTFSIGKKISALYEIDMQKRYIQHLVLGCLMCLALPGCDVRVIEFPTWATSAEKRDHDALVGALREAPDVRRFQAMVDDGRNVNARNVAGYLESVLLIATFDNNADAVEILLSHGADPNAANGDGWTPLMEASQAGDLAIVELLLKFGADVNQQERIMGRTAVHIAASHGRKEILAAMANYSPDYGIRTTDSGATALEYAKSYDAMMSTNIAEEIPKSSY